MLLTADAEAGEVPIDPGPVDVLKVAHHGSEDAGLGALLDRTTPRLAVISVGAGNPYGHPAAGTLAELARHQVQTLRTDRRGTIELDVDQNSFVVRAGAAEAPQRMAEAKLGFPRLRPLAHRRPGPMVVTVASKVGQALTRSLGGLSLAEGSMLLRLRRASIALLGLVGAVGLGLVFFISQIGWPGVLSGPLPGTPTRVGTVHDAIALTHSGPAIATARPATVSAGQGAGGAAHRGSGLRRWFPGRPLQAARGRRRSASRSWHQLSRAPRQPAPAPEPVTPAPAPAATPTVASSPPPSTSEPVKTSSSSKTSEAAVAKAVSDNSKSAAATATKSQAQKSAKDQGASSGPTKSSEASSAKAKRDESVAKTKAKAPPPAARAGKERAGAEPRGGEGSRRRGESQPGRSLDSAAMAALASLYLIAGTDQAKIDATRARLRARAEGDGGAGALEVFEASEGKGSPDHEALLAAIPAMSLTETRRYLLADGVDRWRERQLDRGGRRDRRLAARPDRGVDRPRQSAGQAGEGGQGGGGGDPRIRGAEAARDAAHPGRRREAPRLLARARGGPHPRRSHGRQSGPPSQ